MFSFANIGFPGTLNFSSELLIFSTLVGSPFNIITFMITLVPFLSSVVYSIWVFNKIAFGVFTNYLTAARDVNFFEYVSLFSLSFFTIFFGIFSQYIVDFLYYDVLLIVNIYY